MLRSDTAFAKIIERAGGPSRISEASRGQLTEWAVYKWATNGVPLKHWDLVMVLSGANADEMHDAQRGMARARRTSNAAPGRKGAAA